MLCIYHGENYIIINLELLASFSLLLGNLKCYVLIKGFILREEILRALNIKFITF